MDGYIVVVVLGALLTVLEITQILASWAIWCDTKIVRREALDTKKQMQLVRKETFDLHESINVYNVQRGPLINEI